MQSSLTDKINRRLEINSPDVSFDEDLIADYINDACTIINNWRKNKDNKELLSGIYDNKIISYVIESINLTGIEGQSYSSANGITKQMIATPEDNLKSGISQRL